MNGRWTVAAFDPDGDPVSLYDNQHDGGDGDFVDWPESVWGANPPAWVSLVAERFVESGVSITERETFMTFGPGGEESVSENVYRAFRHERVVRKRYEDSCGYAWWAEDEET